MKTHLICIPRKNIKKAMNTGIRNSSGEAGRQVFACVKAGYTTKWNVSNKNMNQKT